MRTSIPIYQPRINITETLSVRGPNWESELERLKQWMFLRIDYSITMSFKDFTKCSSFETFDNFVHIIENKEILRPIFNQGQRQYFPHFHTFYKK